MTRKALWMALMLLPLGAMAAPAAHAADTMKCTMHFTLSGWSVIYQTADGHGRVSCANGQSMKVHITAKGGGLTVGKYKLDDGVGHFSGVASIDDIPGGYATANAHAGVVGSSHAAAMTKGNVSLALTGTGKGWDIGAGFEAFTISKAK
ncbi:MAG TPA: hypothetical protein VN630_03560 [Rhodanobacteraceae bacterium]|nr:hypothetical protein [Rhodanobacteraceae bacterium]